MNALDDSPNMYSKQQNTSSYFFFGSLSNHVGRPAVAGAAGDAADAAPGQTARRRRSSCVHEELLKLLLCTLSILLHVHVSYSSAVTEQI